MKGARLRASGPAAAASVLGAVVALALGSPGALAPHAVAGAGPGAAKGPRLNLLDRLDPR